MNVSQPYGECVWTCLSSMITARLGNQGSYRVKRIVQNRILCKDTNHTKKTGVTTNILRCSCSATLEK